MHIGACVVRLRLPENGSLKGKRQVLRSITDRVKNKFNVAIAEIDDQDTWQMLSLGITCVSNSSSHANEMLSKVVDFIQNSRLDVEMLGYEIEIIHAL